MSRGSIRRRGKASWELKFDMPSEGGTRQTRYVSVKGKRSDAERELTRLLNAADSGTLVEPTKLTVAGHLRVWLDAADVQPKTLERYRALAEQQIILHLGTILLQRLRPAAVKDWHVTPLKGGAGMADPSVPAPSATRTGCCIPLFRQLSGRRRSVAT